MRTAAVLDRRAHEIIQRMRAFALSDESATAATGTWLVQRGEIRFGPERRWRRYHATQEIDAIGLGFRWRARVSMAPLLPARVVDAFEHGLGVLEARLFGVRFAHAIGPEVDRGECQRLLAELPWCPIAFGHPRLSWHALDDRSLVVTHNADDWRASVLLEVDDLGRVVSASAPDRPRQVGRQSMPMPWVGRYHDYRRFGAIRVPTTFGVDWEPGDGAFTYVRGEVFDARVMVPSRDADLAR